MEDVTSFLKRAAEKCGFTREYYVEKNVPTNHGNLVVFHFHGDTRSEFILSSLILKRLREEMRMSKYLIVCGWRGHRGLFPYADEYWSVTDDTALTRLVKEANGFENESEVYTVYQRNLNMYFENVMTADDILLYYDNGLTRPFLDKFQTVKTFLPQVPSSTILEARVVQEIAHKQGFKVFVMPTKYMKNWRQGKPYNFRVRREFWDALLTRLEKEGYTPLVCQNYATYDLSAEHNAKAVFIREDDVSRMLGAMRLAGCVLDVFTGTSRLAVAARTPFVVCDDRQRFNDQKEYEIDALCAENLPRQYIFTFPTLIEVGEQPAWETSVFDTVAARLKTFLPTIDRNSLPSTSEGTFEVPYSVVRERKAKRIGARFVKIPKD
jgi:hypothetical protein